MKPHFSNGPARRIKSFLARYEKNESSEERRLRKIEVNSLAISSVATTLQTLAFMIVGFFAYQQWSSDKAQELAREWSSQILTLAQLRINRGIQCAVIVNKEQNLRDFKEIHNNIIPIYDKNGRVIYAGLIDEYAKLDEFANKAMIVDENILLRSDEKIYDTYGRNLLEYAKNVYAVDVRFGLDTGTGVQFRKLYEFANKFISYKCPDSLEELVFEGEVIKRGELIDPDKYRALPTVDKFGNEKFCLIDGHRISQPVILGLDKNGYPLSLEYFDKFSVYAITQYGFNVDSVYDQTDRGKDNIPWINLNDQNSANLWLPDLDINWAVSEQRLRGGNEKTFLCSPMKKTFLQELSDQSVN